MSGYQYCTRCGIRHQGKHPYCQNCQGTTPMTEITVHTLPHCTQCGLTKKLLRDVHLKYREVDLEEDPSAHHYVTDILGHRQAPITTVTSPDGYLLDHWHGFNPPKIHEWAAKINNTQAA